MGNSVSRLLTRWTPLWLALLPAIASAQFPRVDSFAPAFGEPGTQVTIHGFFSTTINTVIQFGSGGAIAAPSSLSSSQIVVTVPDNAQTGPISVTQGFTANSPQQFYVAPRIESFERQGSPDVIFAAIGDNVQVEGANFISGQTTVKVGATAATSVTVTAPTQLFFVVPSGAETGPLTVQTFAGLFTTETNLIVSGSAVITGFTPTNGIGGTPVTINGGDFTHASGVAFNGVSVFFDVTSSSQIIATAPTNAGSGPITVTTPNGTATSLTPFHSVSQAPVISSFSPSSGKAGDPIVIEGLNFQSVTNVDFNGVNAEFGATSDTQINAIVPTNVTSGPITLSNSHGSTSSDTSFGVEPVISDFAPIAGTVGTPLTINGVNLSEVTDVMFNGTSADFTRTGPDQIQTSVPFGATDGPITVIAPSGTNTTDDIFTVTFGVPLITGFTPTNGLSGSEIILSGIHFSGVTNITFNGESAASFGVTSDSQITVFPPGTATTGPLTVFGPAGTNQSTNLFYFPPHLTSFGPTRGAAASTITIEGTNFTGATSVEFTGPDQAHVAAAFTIDNDQEITARVPTNIVNGPLRLTTPGGRFITSTDFVVVPRLDGFTPTLGRVGSEITIVGQNFEQIANVRFNGLNANFRFLNSTQLVATVPHTATTGPISFRATQGDITTATNDFIVTRPSDLQLSQTYTPAFPLEQEPIEILLSVTNTGPSLATDVVVTHELDTVFNVQSVDSTLGDCTFTNHIVTCTIPFFTNGQSAQLTVIVTALVDGNFFSSASVTSAEGDPFSPNNSASVAIPVVFDGFRLLSITNLGNQQVELRWKFSAVQFNLQTTPNLLNAETPWQTVTEDIFTVTQEAATATQKASVFHVFTNPISPTPRFFRLIRE